jgi:hypothetical protein
MSSVAEQLQRKSQKPVATKQVRLKLVYIDFWSAVKLSFLVAVSLGVVTVAATIFVYLVLQSTSVFSSLDGLFGDILSTGEQGSTFSIAESFPLSLVATFALVVAVLNIVVGTALGAITSILYNLSVRLTGGLLVGFTNN